MRILILSQWFDPEPTLKGLRFARALAQAGHEVRVITGFPNYPGGRLYPGYRLRLWHREQVDGIQITRVYLFPSHSRSKIGRALNYLTFFASALVATLCTRFAPDVIYAYHPPLTVGVVAAIAGRIRRVPFVYDIQDLWPDTLTATGMVSGSAVLTLVGRVAGWVYRRAALLVAQSPGFVGRLTARGVAPERIQLIYNWCDETALSHREPTTAGPSIRDGADFTVLFAGNLGAAQGLRAVLDAAELVARQRPGVHFAFVGDGTDRTALEAYAVERGLSNVRFVARVPMSQVGHLLDAADALLVHLKASPLFTITVPSKIQAYLYAGRPIIAAVEGDAADLVTRAGAGMAARSEDAPSIAEAVLRMASLAPAERAAMGQRGRAFYDEHLALSVGVGQMLNAFERAVATPVGSVS